MSDEPKRVVWILGAGFSRALGGPLLDDLLSLRSITAVEAQYGVTHPVIHSAEAVQVRSLYYTGSDPARSQQLWPDAEGFLDVLALASTRAAPRNHLTAVLRKHAKRHDAELMDPSRLTRAAQGMLAAECCAFLADADAMQERWQPYVEWAAALTHADTVVTFNYDRVVELAAQGAIEQKLGEKGVHVVTFDKGLDAALELDRPKRADQPILLKLHGSVDWKLGGGAGFPFQVAKDPEYAIKAALDEPLSIATPGPAKKTLTETSLKPLWDLAIARTKTADAVVFVGYRFPPSDAQARQAILAAISDNRPTARKELVLHTVLGPSSPDQARLEQLLQFAARRGDRSYRVMPTALFAEDFLSVWSRSTL